MLTTTFDPISSPTVATAPAREPQFVHEDQVAETTTRLAGFRERKYREIGNVLSAGVAQAFSRTPPISLKTAVKPSPSRCSSAITCETALISARWVNACGKLPRWRPVGASSSSA